MTNEPQSEESMGLEARLAALEDVVSAVGRAVEGHTAWLTDMQRWVSSCVNAMVLFGADTPRGAEPGLGSGPDVIGRLLAWTEIQTVMSWIRDAAEVTDGPLVSVTMATRDRPASLRRAVASVLAQSYRRLELVVADDSDRPDTEELLEQIDDPRVRRVRTPARRGVGAAFNAALDGAEGQLITFLDDDNVMHPEWVRSMVWAFGQRPKVDALYGARILEDVWTTVAGQSEAFPVFQFSRYDRRRHERGSSIDRNVLAVRSRRKALRYDETLRCAPDWDYTLRLFAQTEPLALPVIACYYGTSGPDRISANQDIETLRRIRSRAHSARPLSIHVHRSGADPAGVEGVIGELTGAGATVSMSSVVAPHSFDGQRLDLKQALEDAQPDLVLSDAPTPELLELLPDQDLPFALTSRQTDVPQRAEAYWLGVIDGEHSLEPSLRDALTRWLYQRTADWTGR